MRTLGILFLGAPIGYVLLTGYLLARMRPVPVTALSSVYATKPELKTLAA